MVPVRPGLRSIREILSKIGTRTTTTTTTTTTYTLLGPLRRTRGQKSGIAGIVSHHKIKLA